MSLSSLLTIHSRDVRCFLYGVMASLALVVLINYSYGSNGLIFPSAIHEGKAVVASSSSENSLRKYGNDETIPIPMLPFPEPAWRTPQTISVRTVTSTPFARFEIHKVKTESGEIVNDWLWTDERAHVNILVHLKEENKYLLFHQKKYGLEKPYFAAIGGLFNVGDTPEGCARRELLEETGLETNELVYLGAYRVQVNRGGGILHAYLAKNCVKSKNSKKSDDYEKQEKRLLTKSELLKEILSHNIGEAQWLAAIATGILYEDYAGKLK
jgi:ADP-ribose pyrophosphatase